MDETDDISPDDSSMQLVWIKVFVICGLLITTFAAACLPWLLFRRYGRTRKRHQRVEAGRPGDRFRDILMSCLAFLWCWNASGSTPSNSEDDKSGTDNDKKNNSSKLLPLLNCFSGGVFLGTSFLALMPEIRGIFDGVGIVWPTFNSVNTTYITDNSTDTTAHEVRRGTMMPITEILVTCGLFLVLCLEQGVHAIIDRDTHSKKKSSCNLVHLNAHATPLTAMRGTNTPSISINSAAKVDSDFDAEGPENNTLIACNAEGERSDLRHHHTPTMNFVNVTVVTSTCGKTVRENVTENDLPFGECPEKIYVAQTEPYNDSVVRSLIFLAILSIHSLLEGLAIGLQNKISSVLSIFIAVVFHKSLMAFSMGNNLVQTRHSAKRILFASAVFACMSPAGVGIGIAMNETEGDTKIVHGVLQGIATGTFLFMTFFEVLANEFCNQFLRVHKTVAFMLGYGCILAVMFAQHGAKTL